MLDLDPQFLLREIDRWRTHVKDYMLKRRELIRVITGNNYLTGSPDPSERVPENYAYAYKQFVRPQLLFGTPSVKVRALRAYEDIVAAEAHQMGLNDWIKQTDCKGLLAQIIDDCFVGCGITKATIEARGDHGGAGLPAVGGDFENVPLYPCAMRIDPPDFICDPDAKKMTQARFLGHTFSRDLDDAKADERYDPEARQKLVSVMETKQRELMAYPANKSDDRDRNALRLHELYVPEQQLIVTLAEMTDAGGIILRSSPYLGPDEGPYTLWGLDTVPGELLPIPPLMALFDEFMELQEHSRAMARAAKSHKKIGLAPLNGAKDAETVKNCPAGHVGLVQDPAQFKEMELGGATQYQQDFVEFLRHRLDRNMGFTDSQRGAAIGNSTATEANIAAGSADLRVDGMRDRIHDALLSLFRKILFFFHEVEEIGPILMMKDDPLTGQQVPGVFYPGRWYGGYVNGAWVPPQPESDYADFALELDVRSMTKQDDALEQKRAQDDMTLAFNLAGILGPQMLNWRALIDEYGNAFNRPNLSKIWLTDTQGLMMPMDPTQMAAQGQPSTGSPQGQQQQGPAQQMPMMAGGPSPQQSFAPSAAALPRLFGGARGAPADGAGGPSPRAA